MSFTGAGSSTVSSLYAPASYLTSDLSLMSIFLSKPTEKTNKQISSKMSNDSFKSIEVETKGETSGFLSRLCNLRFRNCLPSTWVHSVTDLVNRLLFICLHFLKGEPVRAAGDHMTLHLLWLTLTVCVCVNVTHINEEKKWVVKLEKWPDGENHQTLF